MHTDFTRSLFRPKSSKRRIPRIGTFDLETKGLGGKLIIAAVCDDNDNVTTYRKIPELLAEMMRDKNRGILWFAHNAGNYDFKYLMDHLVTLKVSGDIFDLEFLLSGQKFIQISIVIDEKRKNVVTLRDSFALIPTSLAHLSHAFAPQYEKGEIDFDKEDFNPRKKTHMEYLHNDVLGLRYSILKLTELCLEHFNVVPAVTAGSTAMNAWKHTIPEGTFYYRTHQAAEDFVRQGYFGGMVYLKNVNTENKNMVKLDISGAYGYAMKTFPMPVGSAVHTDTYELGKIGFYRCIVIAPENLEKYIVGVKDKSGVVWARGMFETTIDSYTYEYALTRGYQIEVLEGYYFERQEYVFKEFIERCETLEFANKGNAIGDTAKLMRNSLYGKYGTNPHKKEYGILKECIVRDETHDTYDMWTECCVEETGEDHPYLCERNIILDAAYMMPHWAACITALVRIYLDQLDSLLEYSFVYNDTDSSVVPQEVYERCKHKLPSDNAYGKFKVEDVFETFLIKGPKAYIGHREDDTYDMKAKGIPRRLLTPEIVINGGRVEFTSLRGIIPMMKEGVEMRNDTHRTVTDIRNSYHWIVSDNNTVFPLLMQ